MFIQVLLEPCRNSMNMKTKSMLLHGSLDTVDGHTPASSASFAVFRISELIAGGKPVQYLPKGLVMESDTYRQAGSCGEYGVLRIPTIKNHDDDCPENCPLKNRFDPFFSQQKILSPKKLLLFFGFSLEVDNQLSQAERQIVSLVSLESQKEGCIRGRNEKPKPRGNRKQLGCQVGSYTIVINEG